MNAYGAAATAGIRLWPALAGIASDAILVLPQTLGCLSAASFSAFRRHPAGTEIIESLDVPHEYQPYAQLSYAKFRYASVFSDFFHRVTGSQHSQEEPQLISARIIALIWVSDFIVDDFALPRSLQIEVIRSLAATVTEGKQFEYDFCAELSALSLMTLDLHHQLRRAPRGDFVISGIEALANIAIRQLEEKPSIALSEEVGAWSFEALARVAFAFNLNAPERILRATRPFGSILQLLDDLWDRERDILHGIATFATKSFDISRLKSDVSARISELRKEMVAPLLSGERAQFQALLAGATMFFALKGELKTWKRLLFEHRNIFKGSSHNTRAERFNVQENA